MKRYDLEIILASPAFMKKLNRRYRGKNKPTTVLAFPLSKNQGQLFLAPRLIKKKDLGRILIHGLQPLLKKFHAA